MTYETFSPCGPLDQSGVDPATVQVIPHNPMHPNRLPEYPAKYPEFVRPTNDRMSKVTVSDEAWSLSDIDQSNSNRLFLHHQPAFKTQVTTTDGVIDAALTDYENGIIYFSTLPTGDFTLSYVANPDKYYGEYLESIQDVIMKIAWLLGAGDTDSGLRNAELFVDSLPDALKAKLPSAISFRAIDRDIVLASSTDPGAPGGTTHLFTFGNGLDSGVLDFDLTSIKNVLEVGESGASPNPNVDDGDVLNYTMTGAMFTGSPQTVRVACYGDMFVAGDIVAMGSLVEVQGTKVINTQITQGDTQLGESTLDKLYVAGDADITGGLTALGVTKDHTFDRSIVFTDGSLRGVSDHVSTIDNLDPSLIEHVRKYYAGDHRRGTVIEGARGAFRAGLTSAVGAANELVDGNISAVYTSTPTIGNYYYRKFRNDPGWFAVMFSGPDIGTKVRVVDFDPSAKKWTLANNLPSGAAATGTSFRIYHDGASGGYLGTSGSNQVQIYCSETFPLVATRNGVVKIRTTPTTLAIPSTDGTYYVFMNMATASGSAEETEPTFFYTSYPNPGDNAVLLGEVTVASSVISSTHCLLVNRYFDSLWMKFDTPGSGWTRTWQAAFSFSNSWHDAHGRSPIDAKVSMLIAPHDMVNDGPDYSDMKVAHPEDVGVRIGFNANGITFDATNAPSTYFGNSLPFWMRVTLR